MNRPDGSRGPLHVLIADDHVDGAESLAELLRLEGFVVHTVHNGEQAVTVARELQPDVMILDIAMPRADGHAVARTIRAEPWGPTVLLIAASGFGAQMQREMSRASGFDHHLVKPLDIEHLVRVLRARDTQRASASG